MSKRELLKSSEVLVLAVFSFRPSGANGPSRQLKLGLLLDTLGPLRSCFDFQDVILSKKCRRKFITKFRVGSVTTETRKG